MKAIDGFLNLIEDAGCHNLVDKILPEAFEQAIIDADSLFKIDMPATQMEDYARGDKNSHK